MEILTNKHPSLHLESEPVTVFDNELKIFTEEMFALMYAAKGVGLAANQVGDQRAIAVVDPQRNGKRSPLVLINPTIKNWSRKAIEVDTEGCLSLPKKLVYVPRYTTLTIQNQSLEGRIETLTFRGFLARIIQHELEHLSGKTILQWEK